MQTIYSLDEIKVIAKQIIDRYYSPVCIAFYAEMGSGKTTLIRALCDVLGVVDNVNSPTFSIINEYATNVGLHKVYHMDWYRLKNARDAVEAGVEDILHQENVYCFIEWPEIAPNLLPPDTVQISLRIVSETERMLSIR